MSRPCKERKDGAPTFQIGKEEWEGPATAQGLTMTQSNSTHSQRVRITNSGGKLRILWIEPWGDEVPMQPGETFEVVALGPSGDCLEVEASDVDLLVYGWPRSTLSVSRSTGMVREYDIPAPRTPPNNSGDSKRGGAQVCRLVPQDRLPHVSTGFETWEQRT